MPLSLGSRASLKPSPTMFTANTSSMIASPGAKAINGYDPRYLLPALTIPPQAANGCSIPIPKKLNPASASIAPPISIVSNISNGDKQL